MSKLPPRKQGWYLFRGVRHSKRPGHITHLHEPVKVIIYPYPTSAKRELAVVMAGRAAPLPISAFDGEWEVIDLERIAA